MGQSIKSSFWAPFCPIQEPEELVTLKRQDTGLQHTVVWGEEVTHPKTFGSPGRQTLRFQGLEITFCSSQLCLWSLSFASNHLSFVMQGGTRFSWKVLSTAFCQENLGVMVEVFTSFLSSQPLSAPFGLNWQCFCSYGIHGNPGTSQECHRGLFHWTNGWESSS